MTATPVQSAMVLAGSAQSTAGSGSVELACATHRPGGRPTTSGSCNMKNTLVNHPIDSFDEE